MSHRFRVVFTCEQGETKPMFLERIPNINEKIIGLENWHMMVVTDVVTIFKNGREETTTVYLDDWLKHIKN